MSSQPHKPHRIVRALASSAGSVRAAADQAEALAAELEQLLVERDRQILELEAQVRDARNQARERKSDFSRFRFEIKHMARDREVVSVDEVLRALARVPGGDG